MYRRLSRYFATQFRGKTFVSIQKEHPSIAERLIVQRPILVGRKIIELTLYDLDVEVADYLQGAIIAE